MPLTFLVLTVDWQQSPPSQLQKALLLTESQQLSPMNGCTRKREHQLGKSTEQVKIIVKSPSAEEAFSSLLQGHILIEYFFVWQSYFYISCGTAGKKSEDRKWFLVLWHIFLLRTDSPLCNRPLCLCLTMEMSRTYMLLIPSENNLMQFTTLPCISLQEINLVLITVFYMKKPAGPRWQQENSTLSFQRCV